jgi:hypothetical protein
MIKDITPYQNKTLVQQPDIPDKADLDTNTIITSNQSGTVNNIITYTVNYNFYGQRQEIPISSSVIFILTTLFICIIAYVMWLWFTVL